ncbi:MAG: glucose-6-phosphate dehydrogenase [Pseudomonadota bacterium]
MVARIVPVDPFDLVVFGGTGDLSKRKLIPALFHRRAAGQMPADARIFGSARTQLDDDAFRDLAREAIATYVKPGPDERDLVDDFLKQLHYVPVDAKSDAGWAELRERLGDDPNRVRAFYLSVSPSFFQPICEQLDKHGLRTETSRLVVEKPIGHDLASATSLNRELSSVFSERNVYRIDHYLGKETVQNLMALRFANALFEPLWNARHIDHVQITVAESTGVGGRGGYYDHAGAMRDMVQNHLLQLLCLTAMEPPSQFEPDAVRDEKLKVLRALTPIDTATIGDAAVRGQYAARGDEPSYRDEAENPSSATETFVALKVEIANWRWTGTPFYLRTGKKLRSRMSEIAVRFRDVPHSIFAERAGTFAGNELVMRLQPDEAITLQMTIKDPGPGGMRLTGVPLDMSFAQSLGSTDYRMPDAYERLVMDVIRGDQTLFMRGDEVEAAWAWIDPIMAVWASEPSGPRAYDPGSSGPEDALMLLHRDGRRWREIAI